MEATDREFVLVMVCLLTGQKSFYSNLVLGNDSEKTKKHGRSNTLWKSWKIDSIQSLCSKVERTVYVEKYCRDKIRLRFGDGMGLSADRHTGEYGKTLLTLIFPENKYVLNRTP